MFFYIQVFGFAPLAPQLWRPRADVRGQTPRPVKRDNIAVRRKRGFQAPEINSGDSPLGTRCDSGLPLTAFRDKKQFY